MRRHPQQLLARLHQGIVADTGAIHELEVKTCRVAELNHRGWGKRDHHRVPDPREVLHRAPGNGLHPIGAAESHLPVLQGDERDPRALATAAEAVTPHGEHGPHIRFLLRQEIVPDLAQHARGALLGGTGRGAHLHEQEALVLLRQKPAWQPQQQEAQDPGNRYINQQIATGTRDDVLHAREVCAVAMIENAIEPAKEAVLRPFMALGRGFEKRGAQRGREDQRHQH